MEFSSGVSSSLLVSAHAVAALSLLQQIGAMKLPNYKPAMYEDGYICFSYDGGSGSSIGDIRISFECARCCEVSVTAVQAGQSFKSMRYKEESSMPQLTHVRTSDFNLVPGDEKEADCLAGSENFEDEPGVMDDIGRGVRAIKEANFSQLAREGGGCCCLGCKLAQKFMDATAPSEMFVVREGTNTSEENIGHAGQESSMMLFMLRIFGFLLMWGGLRLLFDPLSTLFRWIPLIDGILIWGVILLTGSIVALWMTLGGIGSSVQQSERLE